MIFECAGAAIVCNAVQRMGIFTARTFTRNFDEVVRKHRLIGWTCWMDHNQTIDQWEWLYEATFLVLWLISGFGFLLFSGGLLLDAM